MGTTRRKGKREKKKTLTLTGPLMEGPIGAMTQPVRKTHTKSRTSSCSSRAYRKAFYSADRAIYLRGKEHRSIVTRELNRHREGRSCPVPNRGKPPRVRRYTLKANKPTTRENTVFLASYTSATPSRSHSYLL